MMSEPTPLEVYDALKQSGRLKAAVIAEWRCKKKGCLLGRVFPHEGELYFYAPPYRLSPARHEAETTPRARESNTFDGVIWKPRIQWLEFFKGAESVTGMDATCQHMQNVRISAWDILRAAEEGRPGKPVRTML